MLNLALLSGPAVSVLDSTKPEPMDTHGKNREIIEKQRVDEMNGKNIIIHHYINCNLYLKPTLHDFVLTLSSVTCIQRAGCFVALFNKNI